jgi:hypothetical protein
MRCERTEDEWAAITPTLSNKSRDKLAATSWPCFSLRHREACRSASTSTRLNCLPYGAIISSLGDPARFYMTLYPI